MYFLRVDTHGLHIRYVRVIGNILATQARVASSTGALLAPGFIRIPTYQYVGLVGLGGSSDPCEKEEKKS